MTEEAKLGTGITLRNYLANVFVDIEVCLENAIGDGRILGANLAYSELERTLAEVREAAKVIRERPLYTDQS